MRITSITLGYLKWHYGRAIISLTGIWKNFLHFLAEYFSLKLLFRNFFDPWKRMTDSYPPSFDLRKYFYAFIANSIMRIVGMIIRAGLILIGLTVYVLFALLYPVALVLWLILPVIMLGLIIIGLYLIIT